MRKLATIRTIKEKRSIEGADNIELVIIDGWQCVSKKNEFDVGSLCVYLEIDSLLPIRPEFEFLRKSSYKKFVDGTEGFRLKSIKLRGALSQGLVLPIATFPELGDLITNEERVKLLVNALEFYATQDNYKSIEGWSHEDGSSPSLFSHDPESLIKQTMNNKVLQDGGAFARQVLNRKVNLKEGDDVSSLLGVVLYEPSLPACLSGIAKGMFPSFIKKTDQERIQNLSGRVDEWKNKTFEVTEKLDGSSCTVYFHQGQVGVCSRNLELIESEGNSFWKVVNDKDIKNKLININRSLAIQGELIGEGIQGNKYKLRGQELYVFDIYDIDTGSYLDPSERVNIIKELDLKHAPVLEAFNVESIESTLTFAADKSKLNKDVEREGVVFKENIKSPDRVSFKAISNKFLLKFEE